MKPIYLCDLHADATGFRIIQFVKDARRKPRCADCGQPATHLCDADTPPNEVNDD